MPKASVFQLSPYPRVVKFKPVITKLFYTPTFVRTPKLNVS